MSDDYTPDEQRAAKLMAETYPGAMFVGDLALLARSLIKAGVTFPPTQRERDRARIKELSIVNFKFLSDAETTRTLYELYEIAYRALVEGYPEDKA